MTRRSTLRLPTAASNTRKPGAQMLKWKRMPGERMVLMLTRLRNRRKSIVDITLFSFLLIYFYFEEALIENHKCFMKYGQTNIECLNLNQKFDNQLTLLGFRPPQNYYFRVLSQTNNCNLHTNNIIFNR